MLDNGIINRFQLWLLVVNFTIGSALLLIPAPTTFVAKQDGWIVMLIATIIGIFITYVMISLACLYPKQNLISILHTLLGKKLGNIIGLLYAWFFLHLSALVIRNAVDFVKAVIMPDTPITIFSIMAGILLLLSVHKGSEILGRFNEFITPFAIVGFWFTIVMVIPITNPDYLQPILRSGIKPLIKGAYSVLAFPFAELVVFLMFIPLVSNKKHIKKVFISAGAVGGLSLTVMIFLTILVLGVKATEMSIYPTYSMARLINIANFLTRVEAVLALAYIIVIFVKIAASFYGSIIAIAQIFNLSEYRSLTFPLVIIVVTLSITLDRSIVEVVDFATTSWTPYGLLFGFIVPLILLGLGYIKKKQKV